jgi:hypothetical protein
MGRVPAAGGWATMDPCLVGGVAFWLAMVSIAVYHVVRTRFPLNALLLGLAIGGGLAMSFSMAVTRGRC